VPDNPSDSNSSRLRRNEPRREPATIDLSATEVRADSRVDAAAAAEESPPAAARAEDANSSHMSEASDMSVRPTPDEVIPTDDSRLSPDPDLPRSSAERATSVPPISPSAEPGRRGFGFPSLLAAGIVGGLLGSGAAMLAEAWWRPRVSRVDARLEQVEQRLAAPQAAPQPALGPLEGRLARLESDNKALSERLNATQALAERSAKEAQAALNRPPPEPVPGPDNAASASVLADLATRLGALEKQAQERTQATTNVQERLGTIQQQAQAGASAAQALERRIADLDQRFAGLAKQLSERGPDAMAASLRVTLADRLGDALDDGAPVGQVLSMLRRLDVKPDTLRPLEPYAQNAAPTAAVLGQEFRPLGQRMIAETRPASGDWDERLWRMLDRVVTVRAVGDPKATDTGSVVGRIEDALARGAIGEAAAAWDALPEAARAVAPEWGAKLKQRAAAEAAARKMYAEALAALEASTR
jgi:hypothetical protein